SSQGNLAGHRIHYSKFLPILQQRYKAFSCHFRQRSESHRTDSMNCTAQNLVANAQNLATMPTPPAAASFEQPPKLGPLGSLRVHWPEYLMQEGLLSAFMFSACIFGALYEFSRSPVRQAITSQLFRRMLMGISMGLTAISIIYSPWGKQSGAHINPSTTFTFFRLGKVAKWDAIFYIVSQFVGGVAGAVLAATVLSRWVSHPSVNYVTTRPGMAGISAAF